MTLAEIQKFPDLQSKAPYHRCTIARGFTESQLFLMLTVLEEVPEGLEPEFRQISENT
jgi:hypothetical protein